MFWLRNKKIIFWHALLTKGLRYVLIYGKNTIFGPNISINWTYGFMFLCFGTNGFDGSIPNYIDLSFLA